MDNLFFDIFKTLCLENLFFAFMILLFEVHHQFISDIVVPLKNAIMSMSLDKKIAT